MATELHPHRLGRRVFSEQLASLALAGIYVVAGTFGLSLASLNPSASAVWPPTGLALAALLLRGYRLWPGVFVGAFLVNILKQRAVETALAIGVGNTLEALVGAWLVQQFCAGVRAFDRAQTIFAFAGLAAILSTMISATLGVTTLCVAGFAQWGQYGAVWLTWWLGDAVSDLVVAPALIIWATQRQAWPGRKQALESVGWLLAVGLVGYVVFLGKLPYGAREQSVEYLAVLPLLCVAFRLGQRGAVTSAFAMSALAVWGTWKGFGPFAVPDRNASLVLLQAFMGTITLTALVLAAIVSERKKAEKALQEATQALAEHARKLEATVAERTARLSVSHAELEAFSYSLSHDMRAPLRAINSFTGIVLLEHRQQLGPAGVDCLERVLSASERLDRLIQDVLALSRVSRQEVVTGTVNVEKLAREIIQERPEFQPPGADVSIQSPLLPVLGHEASLTQCLTNLLANAVKFVPPGVTPRVVIGSEQHGKQVRLWITDNGIGIAPEAQRRIFDMFQRLHKDSEYEGTGIGLAIVRKAIERMGGQAGVESEPGKGSRFWLELPATV